ncbi:hypothetical protein F4780DRAFT_162909 [Xylariomycetidae sp. FL0641]|nr:hypothetical protein F4780DRAFT_162909 [Xylariomycetidae sp. FL0641]
MSTPGTHSAAQDKGQSLTSFLTALSTSLVVFGVQTGLFLLLRNKLARIFKPKTYLVPERERTDPPPNTPWGVFLEIFRFRDREVINKCGLDAYFFLRYLQTLLIIFIPMAVVIIPILVPLNYIDGRSNDFSVSNDTDSTTNNIHTGMDSQGNTITGLDTLAWGNVLQKHNRRYWGHLVLAVCVVFWVCGVFFTELRVYIKVRQDWLTTAEHRLRASATTVLVSEIPDKWLSEEALRGLFDVFPGGLRNIWLTRDLTHLLEKISKRDLIHQQLELAQTDLIKLAKAKQLKKREKEEKQARKAAHAQRMTKQEKAERDKEEDAAAKLRAEGNQGISSGDRHEVPHEVSEAEADMHHADDASSSSSSSSSSSASSVDDVFSTGLAKLSGKIGKTGQEIIGGAKSFTEDIDDQIETTNGFVSIGAPRATSPAPPSRGVDRHIRLPNDEDLPRPSTQNSNRLGEGRMVGTGAHHTHTGSLDSMLKRDRESIEMRQLGNTTRKADSIDDMYLTEQVRWYQFWKPPTGGFASPIPQGSEEGTEFPFEKPKTFFGKLKAVLLGVDPPPIDYPKAFNDEFHEDKDGKAEWEKWLKKSDRPTHRLANFEWTPGFLPGLPFLNKKVDTIYWCREELARLNLEIEEDQKNPTRYPLMKSAFIQFNHQVAAHMACQSVIHHVPKHMAPRTVEISPNDVLWENMAVSWWSEWLRTALAVGVVFGMILLWAIPVGFTGSLSQLDDLIKTFPWLGFLADDQTIRKIATAIAGVLPAVLLALLLFLVPIIMDFLAGFKGAKTGTQKSESVQKFYFAFLFVQVFLIVSLASGAIGVLQEFSKDPTGIAEKLATKIPEAANYFFSYMILQALSVSSGTLLQIGALLNWYVIARIMNSTARSKWQTNTKLPQVNWGTYFPVYTNFACIALIYSIIAPIISIFAIITFSLLWIANRYAMLYVTRFTQDTGGVLYPRAINQTFTGLYVMELALIGLFFLVQDEDGSSGCFPQAIIMIVVTALTVLYQFLLNLSFGPLFRYLPITFEDEAVLRDEAFQRAQDRRLGLIEEEEATFDKEGMPSHHHRWSGHPAGEHGEDGQVQDEHGHEPAHGHGHGHVRGHSRKLSNFKPVKGIVHASTWAARGGRTTYDHTFGKAEQGLRTANKFREERKQKDLEAQRAIGEALYGGFHDEIEDLTPEERDLLVRRAFMHSALRARRPTLWIPRDDIGVSDDEIKRTRDFSDHIWISNEGTALDSKVRVVYGRAPPDFSELDIIQL